MLLSNYNYFFVHIGNHSHTHEYLADMSDEEIRKDLQTAKELFKKNLSNNTKFFHI